MTRLSSNPRVFGVDYQFLSCGNVFTQGLVNAAAELGITYVHADWSAPHLREQIRQFDPDLVFVVHGRRAAHLMRDIQNTAVWLLDEPYEVDDTSQWSIQFTHVFVSDRATLDRHHAATYLPVCYDPHIYTNSGGPRPHAVGFIGGGNGTRERYLATLARAGLLTYVVGGTWSDQAVNERCLSNNIAPVQTARLYQQTRIVLNVFREVHHFNREGIPATALNPRVYEALACGALVVSEWRPEIDQVVPELPTFRSEEECRDLIAGLLAEPDRAEDIRQRCAERLKYHTYANRLQTVLAVMGLAVAA